MCNTPQVYHTVNLWESLDLHRIYRSNCLFTTKGTSIQPLVPDAPKLQAHQSIIHEFLVSPTVIQHFRACRTWQEVLGKFSHVCLGAAPRQEQLYTGEAVT